MLASFTFFKEAYCWQLAKDQFRLTCNFCKFFNNLVFCFTFRDGANKESIISHRDAHADLFSWSYFIIVALWKNQEQAQVYVTEQK